MAQVGYALSSEEHDPIKIVDLAKEAETHKFPFALISDHFHPWLNKQGQSPFVWSSPGAISQITKMLQLGTGVTAPIMRIHPVIIAQAAATIGYLMKERFFLGLGTGEFLNEHVTGEGWPPYEIRKEMLIEAVEIIRILWKGGTKSYYGAFYTVDSARIYSLPEKIPPIYIAASGKKSAEMAGKIGDGLISTSPQKEIVEIFENSGGKGKPKYAQITVCYDKDEAIAKQIAHEWWRNTGLQGTLSQDLKTPMHFEAASALITSESVAKEIICGPDIQKHKEGIQKYIDAGFDYVYVHQVGPNQSDFFSFYEKKILPSFNK